MAKRQAMTIDTAAGPMICDARKAAFLPAHETLLLADMHFEKGSFLQMNGHVPLPSYDTKDSLARLADIVADYQPKSVMALGDSFHDVDADQRLSKQDCANMNAIIQTVDDFVWILGNHDPDIPEQIVGRREDHQTVGGFLLTHHPTEPDPGGVNVCGHLHPKLRVKLAHGRASGPCFALSASRIILPSFGSYTGGLWVDHPAIATVMDSPAHYGLIYKAQIYPLAA